MFDTDACLYNRLIECALALLERGARDISLRAVAREAGVSAMAPYRHFADKSALMAAVALRGFTMLESDAEAADAADSAADALSAQGLSYINFARRHPTLFRLMFADDAGMTLPKEKCQGAFGLMARRVAELSPDQAKAGALACWGLVHGLAMLALDGRLSPDPQADRAALAVITRAFTAPA